MVLQENKLDKLLQEVKTILERAQLAPALVEQVTKHLLQGQGNLGNEEAVAVEVKSGLEPRVAMMTIDGSGHIEYADGDFSSILPATLNQTQIIGKNVGDVFSFDANLANMISQTVSETLAGKQKIGFVGKNGETRVYFKAIPFGEDRAMLTIFDFTFLQVQFDDRAKHLEAIRMKTHDLLRLYAHAIKNPLTTINNNTYLLQMLLQRTSPDVKQCSELLSKLQSQVGQVDELINNLIHQTSLEFEEVLELDLPGLPEFIEAECQSLIDLGSKNGIRVNFKYPEPEIISEHSSIPLSKMDVWIIVDNLLSNAIKYTEIPKNGEKKQVWVRFYIEQKEKGPFFVIEVEDQGKGIDPEDQEFVFSKGQRGAAVQANGNIHSHGLGLYVTKDLVENVLGGSISYQTNLGEESGTTFQVRLPIN